MTKLKMLIILMIFALLTGCNQCQTDPEPQPQPNPEPQPGNRAVIVGINAYPNAPLSGCVNDALNMKDLLITQYSFKEDQIKMLTDSNATTESILTAMVWLTEDVKEGDKRLFHYSGHGAEYVDTKLHQIICPVDFDWTPQHMITDTQFVAVFSKLPDDVLFNWVNDSCHSGGLTMGVSNKKLKPRAYPIVPLSMADKIEEAKKTMTFRGFVNGILDVGFVSGCKSNQTSADAYIDGKWQGALTHYLLKNLRAIPQEKLEIVVTKTREDVNKNGYTQEPQAEGARVDKPFLE